MRSLAILATLAIPAVACSSKDSATIQLETGGETDTFTQSPVPTTLLVQSFDTSNPPNATTLASQPFPVTSVDLGNQSESTSATLVVSGLDANMQPLIYGASLLLDFGGLVDETVPIFVQRVGESARLPGTLDARTAPLLSQVQSEFVFVAGANEQAFATTSQLYDFGQLLPFTAPPPMPVIPLSMAVVGTVAMLFDGTGATYFDLSQNASAQVPALAGHSFAEVAGGQTIVASDGTTYVVGGTRTIGSPTATVLRINPNDASNANYPPGNLSWLSLSAPRFGASATFVANYGIVVAGGSATAAGVEVLPVLSATSPITGSALPYPPDPTVGAGAATTDNASTVVLAGGLLPTGADPGVRVLALSCTTCTATTSLTLPTPIGTANTFDIDPCHLLVVGNELASGLTHVFLVTDPEQTSACPAVGSVSEIATKVPHENANAIVSPVGSVVILGGNAQMESVQLIVPPSQ